MSNLFKYAKLSTKSSFETPSVPKKKYSDYKSEMVKILNRHMELINDPSQQIKQGKNKDPAYIMRLSRVADDLSFIELTLRCGRKLFDFGLKNEKYLKYLVPNDARTEDQVRNLRLALLSELIERVENDEYKSQIKTFIRRQEKEGIEKKMDGWYYS